jgi:4-hydroxy-3-methylbut-2-enyl diphosphate reductase
MRIIRATHLGMCFGVRDAIALAFASAEAGPLTILGDLVHNPTVLSALAARGIAVANEVAQVTTHTLMVTAHGASARALASTRALGLHVVEATCPLMHVAHRAVAALVRDGYHVVIIGQRDHVEVRGLTGDLDGNAGQRPAWVSPRHRRDRRAVADDELPNCSLVYLRALKSSEETQRYSTPV